MSAKAFSTNLMLPLFAKIAGKAPILGIFTLCAVGVAVMQVNRIDQLQNDFKLERDKSEYSVEENKLRISLNNIEKLPNSLYNNLFSNWAYLNFIQYFGDNKARKATGYTLNPNFFEIAVQKDPLFLDMYPYLSASVTLYAAQPEQTISLFQRALPFIPYSMQSEAYFMWHLKATDELLFLGRTKDAQKSYEMASKWAGQSTNPVTRSIAARSRQTAKFLASNPDSRRARVGAWFSLLTNAIDDASQQLAMRQIHALGGQVSRLPNGALQVKLPTED
jgi:hypothetical protein